jgi:DNA-binding NtrC family response regulator
LYAYHWPGNVRELRNILERAAILCDGGHITIDHLALTTSAAIAAPPVVEPLVDTEPQAATPSPTSVQHSPPARDWNTTERAMIEQALQTARFNKSKAAKALGLTRTQLYVRMRKHGFQ